MSERISNKKKNFDGIDPQESLIKSLESIKSLLKQGDTKINQARENIARADDISSDKIQDRLNQSTPEIPNTAFISSASIQKPVITEKFTEAQQEFSNIPEFNEINDEILTLEEIIVDAIPEDNIFNSNTKAHHSETNPIQSTNTTPQQVDAPLNELYDHDLIVPMLDEIVIPEDQNSSMFNMDSSVEIKLDSKLTSKLIELSDTENNDDIKFKTNITAKDKAIKSSYNSIKKSETTSNNTKPNADIISFELSSNAIKNNVRKLDNKTIEPEKIKLEKSELKKDLKQSELKVSDKQHTSVSLIEDSLIDIELNTLPPITSTTTDQVVIKETTNNNAQINNPLELTEKNGLTNSASKAKGDILDFDFSPAIDTANFADDVLTNITKSNNEIIKPEITDKPIYSTPTSTSQSKTDNDFSKIEGLEKLEFNANKMESLQKRVEKRVHNRLIQLIVQLDDEIKTIFNDEIKNCIAHELKNAKDKNKNKK